MGREKRSTYFVAVAAIGAFSIVAAASPGHAVSLKTTPSIALEEAWDTNIFNTSSDEQSDFISRATPGLLFSLETERGVFNLSGFLTSEAYADHNELNTWDATKRVELGTPSLKITPRLSLQAAARYFETNDISQRNELVLTPIPDLPPSETFVVVGRTAARTYGGSLQATYQATPNLNLILGGGATKLEYIDARPDLTDSRTLTGNASAVYRITPRTTGGIFGSTSDTAYDGGATSRSYTGGLSASHAATERTSVDARAGMTFLTDTSAAGVVDHNESPYGSLSINYRNGGFGAVLTGSYELTGGGSFGQSTERGNVGLSLTDQFAARWSWDFSGSYQNERSAGAQTALNISTADGTAGVRFAATNWAAVRLSGYTFRQWNRDAADGDITRSHVMLGLTLSDTYLLF